MQKRDAETSINGTFAVGALGIHCAEDGDMKHDPGQWLVRTNVRRSSSSPLSSSKERASSSRGVSRTSRANRRNLSRSCDRKRETSRDRAIGIVFKGKIDGSKLEKVE